MCVLINKSPNCGVTHVLSRSVASDSLEPHGLQPTRRLCPWGFSRQENWSGLPCPPSGDLPNPGIRPMSPTLQVDCLSEPLGKPKNIGVGSQSLLQGNVLTQESNWGFLHCRRILYQPSYSGSHLSLDKIKLLHISVSLYHFWVLNHTPLWRNRFWENVLDISILCVDRIPKTTCQNEKGFYPQWFCRYPWINETQILSHIKDN